MKQKFNLTTIAVSLFLLLNVLQVVAQHQERYTKEHFISGTDTLNYRMLIPNGFDMNQKYPLVLFLHGAGERGSDNLKQLSHGSELFVKVQDSFPSVVIFPQCPQTDYWANVEVDRTTSPLQLTFPKDRPSTKSLTLVMELLDALTKQSDINTNQIYVGGLSMGGMGTFEILARKPEFFAAAFSICGAGIPESTQVYAKSVPMWIFHGAKDDVVSPVHSLDMVSGILKYGGTPNFSLFSQDNHNSWDSAFAEPELIPWLFSNTKSK